MKIRSVQIQKYTRNMVWPWKTSRGIMANRDGIIIRLIDDDNVTGYGEAAPLSGYSKEIIEDAEDILSQASKKLSGLEIPNIIDEIALFAAGITGGVASANFALESACCDLAAKNSGMPLSKWLNPKAREAVPVNYTVTDMTKIDQIKEEIVSGGYPAVKFKVGIKSLKDEINSLRKITGDLPDDVTIRLDANGAWICDEAVEFLNEASEINIEYIEEPLKAYDYEDYKRLKSETGIDIALDETLTKINLEEIISDDAVDILILKPTLMGGISKIRDIVHKVQLQRKRVVLTSLLESEIGLVTLCHLAAALPDRILSGGLDTIRVFDAVKSNILKVKDGFIKVPDFTTGIGINDDTIGRLYGLK